MEYDKNICPVVNVDGVIERGKQYDLDITLPDVNKKIYQFTYKKIIEKAITLSQ